MRRQMVTTMYNDIIYMYIYSRIHPSIRYQILYLHKSHNTPLLPQLVLFLRVYGPRLHLGL